MRVPTCPAILSIIGWHADESPEIIINRKRADIQKANSTIWLYHSQLASVQDVQQFGSTQSRVAVYFIEGGAYPASTSLAARQMSDDRSKWMPLPNRISNVTGRLPGGGLVIGKLSAPLRDHEIDLWDYFEHSKAQPLRFRQGASTACVVGAPNGPIRGMKSRIRKVVAIGQLAPPYAVYLR
jgi:hypothetical protein